MPREHIFRQVTDIIRDIYGDGRQAIPLHVPLFRGNEKQYLDQCIDSTFVSSVGAFVNRVEQELASFTGAQFAVATSNGTSALHAALLVCGVKPGNEVITQSLSFVATGNAIMYCGATPVFIDVDTDSAGMSPESLDRFLSVHASINPDGHCVNKTSGAVIAACVPMHTFGFSCRITEISEICRRWNIQLIEDSAESIGTWYKHKHTGRFGRVGVLSFNGNKTITCGGGGAIITDDATLAARAKHLTTTAKVPHQWEFYHDELGFNYRMPNLNAALLLAQIEQLPAFLESKQEVAGIYARQFDQIGLPYLKPIPDSSANYWLNAIVLADREERDAFLHFTNKQGIMTRPAWTLLNKLPAFSHATMFENQNASWLEDRIVNIPSSAR